MSLTHAVLAVVAGMEQGREALRVTLVNPQVGPGQQFSHHLRVAGPCKVEMDDKESGRQLLPDARVKNFLDLHLLF